MNLICMGKATSSFVHLVDVGRRWLRAHCPFVKEIDDIFRTTWEFVVEAGVGPTFS